MKKWVKLAVSGAAGLAVIVATVAFVGLHQADTKMKRRIDVQVRSVPLRTDPPALERGKYLYLSRGCADCHGADGGGRTFVDNGSLRIRGPNISSGPAAAVHGYSPQDWVLAIRHGVHPTGRPLMIMPSEDYNRFTDDDLASLIAYVRQLPPAAGGPAIVDLPVPVRVLYGLGAIQDAAAKIDHSVPPSQPVPEAVTVEHGRYVANMCLGCHGPQLAGGRIPGGPPDWPPASRLAPGKDSVMNDRYAQPEALLALFRTGKRPDGTEVKVMPFDSLKQMSEVDVRALHLYLKSLR
jgi:mono/diheme cytochrome c family protein